MSASSLSRSALVALALVLAAPSALAEPTPAERETARTLLLSGRDKKKAGKLKEALADFERANGIMHVPTTALDLGKAQEAMGLLIEARASFLEAARFPATADASAAFRKASKEAKSLAESITPRLSTLTVNVTTTSSAKVRIDDAEINSSNIGAPLKLNPGKHDVVAVTSTDEKRQSVDLAEGESKTVSLAPAVETEKMPDGPDDKPPPVGDPKTEKTEKKTSTLVWVGGAIGVVGIGVGAITGLMSLSVRNDLITNQCTNGKDCPRSSFADLDKGQLYGNISTAGFIVGGAGVALMVYGLLTPSRVPVTQPTASVSWWPTPTGLAGTF